MKVAHLVKVEFNLLLNQLPKLLLTLSMLVKWVHLYGNLPMFKQLSMSKMMMCLLLFLQTMITLL